MLKQFRLVVCICAAELLVFVLSLPGHVSGQAARQIGRDLVLLDANDEVLYQTSGDIPTEPVAAAGSGFSVLPVRLEAGRGLLILTSPEVEAAHETVDSTVALVTAFTAVSGIIMLTYALWLDQRILRPFRNIKSVAEEIARGHLEVPLTMDRGGTFGAFTESFDLMRTELERARAAEAKALADKKELIAKLSHDLRTPIASIQAVSELGALTSGEREAARFVQIHAKTLQMSLLVTNLLSAAVEEQTELSVALRCVAAQEVIQLLQAADYQRWMELQQFPSCCVAADPVRLQQVFDNIFANAYKYGRAPVKAEGYLQSGKLLLLLEDMGDGVPIDEVSRLHIRYFRGVNSRNAPGAGLGLYICDELLQAMSGELLVRNGDRGLCVSVILPLCRQ